MIHNAFHCYFFICLFTWCLDLKGFMFQEEITDSDIFTGNEIEENTVSLVINENDVQESIHSENKNTSYIPSKPQNLTVTAISDSTMDLSWNKPLLSSQDEALEYYIYYLHLNKSKTLTKRLDPSLDQVLKSTLTNLEPFTLYKVWVKAKLNSSEGDSSEQLEKMTDVSGPGPPVIINATCIDSETLAFSWQLPLYNKSLDRYIIEYRDEDSFDFKNISVKICNDSCLEPCTEQCKGNEFTIRNLTSEMYEIKITGVTHSVHYEEKEVFGRESPSKKVPMNNCGRAGELLDTQQALNAGVVAGIICACFALLLAIIAFVIWRNCLHAAYYYYLEDSPAPPALAVSNWDTHDLENTVPLARFTAHVAELHADGDIGFSKEYEAIQAMANNLDFTTEHSQHPDNKLKNRYLNILSYDHTRVKLQPVAGQNRVSDYINANYIDGFQRVNAYIGTQGPLPCTFDAFWRMIWEQGVAIIVMITNLVERGRRKCDMYWPKEGVETYGSIQVKLIKEDILAMYTVRTLHIVHSKSKKKKHGFNERLVYQYHYTNWPDHGTPDHPLPILSFVKKSSDANPSDAGPIVVHCSAGVGRTGTYIVLDAMLKQIRHKNEMNIYGFLRHIRTQRNFLVQTEEQYIFIHDALQEAITCSETGLSAECLAHLLRTCSFVPADNLHSLHWHQLQLHFQAITAFQPKDYNLVSANKASNQLKNRNQHLVPVECSRVHLTPKPGVDGSDYINASWCLGFKKLREFIMTQHPLASTVLDFWQMVWDHNAQTVVLLSPISPTSISAAAPAPDADPNTVSGQPSSAQSDAETEPEYCVFWPEDTLDGENFKVRLVEKSELEGTVSRDLTVQSLQDDYELAVRIIQSPVAEPLSDLPALFKLLHTVQQWHLEYQNGPIVVVDRYGGTEAATFCCLATLMKQLDYENHADVCMFAKLYHNRRPGVWCTMDDYLLLYQALEVLSASKGVSLVASPSTSHPTPNGYTTGDLTQLDST